MEIYKAYNPISHLSFERQILKEGCDKPLLLMSRWGKKVLVLGYSQDFNGTNREEIVRNKIEVHRRSSGGTGVLSTDSFNISFFIPASENFSKGIEILYKVFLSAIRDSLLETGKEVEMSQRREKVNSPLCFLSQSGETLLYEGKKFFGGAQARNKNVLLVHGTMLLDFDSSLHHKIFGMDEEFLKSKITSISVDIESLRRKIAKNLHKTILVSSFNQKQ